MSDVAGESRPVGKLAKAFEYRPSKRKKGADRRTKTLAHSAFARHSYRDGRTSPSEGEASGGSGSL